MCKRPQWRTKAHIYCWLRNVYNDEREAAMKNKSPHLMMIKECLQWRARGANEEQKPTFTHLRAALMGAQLYIYSIFSRSKNYINTPHRNQLRRPRYKPFCSDVSFILQTTRSTKKIILKLFSHILNTKKLSVGGISQGEICQQAIFHDVIFTESSILPVFLRDTFAV